MNYRGLRLIDRTYHKGFWRFKFEPCYWFSTKEIVSNLTKSAEKSLLLEYRDALQNVDDLKRRGIGPGPWYRERLQIASRTLELKELLSPYIYDLCLLFGAEPLTIDWEGCENKPYLEFRKRGASYLLTIVGVSPEAQRKLLDFSRRTPTVTVKKHNILKIQGPYTQAFDFGTDFRPLVLDLEAINVTLKEPYFGYPWKNISI